MRLVEEALRDRQINIEQEVSFHSNGQSFEATLSAHHWPYLSAPLRSIYALERMYFSWRPVIRV